MLGTAGKEKFFSIVPGAPTIIGIIVLSCSISLEGPGIYLDFVFYLIWMNSKVL